MNYLQGTHQSNQLPSSFNQTPFLANIIVMEPLRFGHRTMKYVFLTTFSMP